MTESSPPGRKALGLVSFVGAAILDLIFTKPIAAFVWWLSSRANRTEFEEVGELRRRVEEAKRAGRPVLFACNHISMFDDPVLPMTLYGTSARAAVELLVLGILVVLCFAFPGPLLPAATAAFALGIAVFGARKVWWSMGDLVNFSGASALRAKLETGRDRPLSRIQLALLAAADPAIYHFMRSRVVKTVFVDRREGEEAKRVRARAIEEATAIAAGAEPVWIFFEGGRARNPGEIGPARRGIGEIVLALRARGADPLVVAIRHRGLDLVMPRASKRWLRSGHRIEARWAECDLGPGGDAAAVADAVRDRVASIEIGKRGDGVASNGRAGWKRLPGDAWRLLTTGLGWVGIVVGIVAWGVLVIPLTLLLSPVWPGVHARFNDVTHAALALYVRSLLFARFQTEGDEAKLTGARIVVANHQSWLDPIVMIALEPRVGGPVRRYLSRVPVLGTILQMAGFYESEVGEMPSFEEMRRSAELARERGGGLLFFPEGTRSKTGEIGAFHRGAFRTAFDHDLPIQPVVIEGLDHVLPPGKLVVQTVGRYPVRIRYLPPIEPPFGSGLRRDVVRALAERVRGLLADELARLRAERRATGSSRSGTA